MLDTTRNYSSYITLLDHHLPRLSNTHPYPYTYPTIYSNPVHQPPHASLTQHPPPSVHFATTTTLCTSTHHPMAVSTHLAGVVEAAGTEVVELWQRWHGLEGAEQDGGETLSDAGVQLLEVSTGVVSLEQ